MEDVRVLGVDFNGESLLPCSSPEFFKPRIPRSSSLSLA
jgi:hypothetical protein